MYDSFVLYFDICLVTVHEYIIPSNDSPIYMGPDFGHQGPAVALELIGTQ